MIITNSNYTFNHCIIIIIIIISSIATRVEELGVSGAHNFAWTSIEGIINQLPKPLFFFFSFGLLIFSPTNYKKRDSQ